MNTDAITRERFEIWRRRLLEDTATPVLVLGVGHEQHSSSLILCVPEGVKDGELIAFLQFVLRRLKTGGEIPQHDGEQKVYSED